MLETIAAAYSGFIGSISNYLYTYILIVLLVAGGIYFTVRTKFVQFRFLPESIRIVMQPSEDQNSISAFKTLMVSTASRVGTGNIAGISTAICLGGFGAVFWMWVIAIIGGASAFIESTLAQIYKRRNPETGEELRRPLLLHRGCPPLPPPGRHLRCGPDPHLRRRLQHAGLLQPAVHLQRLLLL